MLKLAQAPEDDDDDLTLAQAAAGDAEAFGRLIRRHQAMVYGLAQHFLHDPSGAEDLAQDVFLELYKNLARLQSTAHLRFWLRRVAANRCIDRIRRRANQPEEAFGAVPEPLVPAVSHDVLLESRLRAMVATLPARARLVVILRYQEDLDPAEIAALLRMPLNTVKSHLRRSLEWLRAQLPSETPHEV